MEEMGMLKNVLAYRVAIELSEAAWQIYKNMAWQERKIIGDQFITATDSFGANTAEGFGRYHYLDKVRFYYNARGSLYEAKHWIYLLFKRDMVKKEVFDSFIQKSDLALYQINLLIRGCRMSKEKISVN